VLHSFAFFAKGWEAAAECLKLPHQSSERLEPVNRRVAEADCLTLKGAPSKLRLGGEVDRIRRHDRLPQSLWGSKS
jgi:hypothetical protein